MVDSARRRMMDYLLSRTREASTWRGLVLVATACGVALSAEQQEAIIATGLLVAGLIGALTDDE